MSRVYVYVDGFNLYFGSLQNSTERWLDIHSLVSKMLRKGDSIEHIRYFTARVTDRNGKTGPRLRQQIYLRALGTTPSLTVHRGQFLVSKKKARLVHPTKNGPDRALVWKTEEKGSDVNIATHLIVDGFKERYDCAIVVSNDSDLVGPIRAVRNELRKPVGVFLPTTNAGRRASYDLKAVASFAKEIRRGPLKGSQFPAQLTDETGTITKPTAW